MRLLLLLLLCLLGFTEAIPKAIAIDLGNEWLKLCTVDAQGLELLGIVINEQSNRRSPAIVGFDANEERHTGDAALPLYYRNPASAFPALKRLLGQKLDSSATTLYTHDYNVENAKKDSTRQTVVFKWKNQEVSVEELYVMLLQWSKTLSQQHVLQNNGEEVEIKEAILIIPEYFSLQQKNLYIQLAQLAGLKVVTTIGEITAAGVDYGARNLEPGTASKSIVIYGIGAHSVTASLLHYKKSESGFELEVLNTVTDDTVGGTSFDFVVRDILAQDFDQKYKNKKIASIKSNKKAMTKLLREAREVKEQLSASPTLSVTIEDLYDGIDFQTTITRETFEKESEKLFDQVLVPLHELLASSAATATVPSVIEIFGGGVRIPKIQQRIVSQFPSVHLGKHIDGDEAAVFGAGQYLASVQGVVNKKVGTIAVKELASLWKEDSSTVGVLNEEATRVLTEKLRAYDLKTQEKKESEEARNQLESFIMESKDKVEGQKKLKKEKKEEALEALNSAQLFLEENDAVTVKGEEWKEKKKELSEQLFQLLGVKEETEAEKQKKQQEARAKEESGPKRKRKKRDRRKKQKEDL